MSTNGFAGRDGPPDDAVGDDADDDASFEQLLDDSTLGSPAFRHIAAVRPAPPPPSGDCE